MTLFFELIFGEETEFYQTLLNEDLIDETLDINLYSNLHIVFNYYKCNAISDKLKEVLSELNKYCGNLDEEAFELLKTIYWEFISSLNSPEYIAKPIF